MKDIGKQINMIILALSLSSSLFQIAMPTLRKVRGKKIAAIPVLKNERMNVVGITAKSP